MEISEVPMPLTERSKWAEQRIFASLADFKGIRPFTLEEQLLIDKEFINVNGVGFETPQGDKGRIPYHTDGVDLNIDRLREVGFFNIKPVPGEDHAILAFVDRIGRLCIGPANDEHRALLLGHRYTHDTGLAVPFTNGEVPTNIVVAKALVQANLRDPIINS
ncbi:MAG TPA: hypothetical protein VNW29_00480 [Candidatus Sulfotelmatobacter sp.]|jgi:hypothetical protein|nr:hypothetical protein [Candidatus Sulfotelmatobacter sp.]